MSIHSQAIRKPPIKEPPNRPKKPPVKEPPSKKPPVREPPSRKRKIRTQQALRLIHD
jgi:hypothetical protein